MIRRIEDLIRDAPEQWLMMQPNWPSDFGFNDGFGDEHGDRG